MKIKPQLKKIIIIIIIFILTLLTSFALEELKFRQENILLVYMLGVIVVIVESNSFLWGFISSICYVAAFNFFFTEPLFTFMVNDKNYIVSFVIFIVVAIIANTLTTRLQRQISIAKRNEEITNKLYKISTGFLNLSTPEQIAVHGENSLQELLKKDIVIDLLLLQSDDKSLIWCFQNASPTENESKIYFPLKSKRKTYGVLQVLGKLEDHEKPILNTVCSQVTIALERIALSVSEEENRLMVEKEKIKSNLLRSISHDLRTPLTGIAGGAEFLLQNDSVELTTRREVLSDIYEDANWLSALVENLLNMTRIQDGKLEINRRIEVVDDIIGEVVAKVNKRKGNHKLIVNKPKELLLAPMDAQLMIQMLVNLLDNAFKHTKIDSTVYLSAKSQKDSVVFEVSDNGGGIDKDKLPQIFDSFLTASHEDKGRGIGLGLSICKTIATAHGGNIKAANNKKGGSTFTISLPMEVQNDR